MAQFKDPKVTIKIPRALYNRLKTIIDDSGFDSVTDFVVYVLRDFAAGVADTSAIAESGGEEALTLTAREIQKVRERLKRLGYL